MAIRSRESSKRPGKRPAGKVNVHTSTSAALWTFGLLAVWTFSSAANVACRALADDLLMLASSDQHTWFVASTMTEPRPRLMHHALEMDGPFYTLGPKLAQAPATMAAWGDELWVVNSAGAGRAATSVRSVFRVRVLRNPALGGYYFLPQGRLALEPALPGDGVLAAFAAGADGPIALVLTPNDSRFGSGPGLGDSGQGPRASRLLHLTNGRWDEIELPSTFTAVEPVFLTFAGVQGRTLYLLTADPQKPHRALLFSREPDRPWIETSLGIEPRDIQFLVRFQSQVIAVTGAATRGELDLIMLRGDGAFKLAQIDRPGASWGIGCMDNRFVLIGKDSQSALRWRRFDPLTGHDSEWQPMSIQSLGTTRLIHIPLLVAMAVSVLMLVFLFRTASPAVKVELPDRTTIGSPSARLLALAIDLVPGIIVAIFMTRASLLDLARLPIWTVRLEAGAPALIMIAVTIVHSTCSEIVWHRTLGKALNGLEVRAAGGGRPTAVSVLMRNLGKLVTLLIPPLATIALLNRHMQGLDDMLGRTVVVASGPAPHGGSPESRQ